MPRTAILLLLTMALSAPAAAPRRGKQRLRELVVLPTLHLHFDFGWTFQGGKWALAQEQELPAEIARARSEFQEKPTDLPRLLELACLLDRDGQTNEAMALYESAVQLGRKRADQHPQDGLTLTGLAEALAALGKRDEAENLFHKAVLISSNQWKCWVGLGEFLNDRSFRSLCPETSLKSASARANLSSTRLPERRPAPEAIELSGNLRREAARCFDRAVALAPQNADAFIARAGFQCMSNWDQLLIQQARGSDEIEGRALQLALFPKAAIPDLERAEKLRPNDYRLISSVAYFHWVNALIRGNSDALTPNNLPDATRRSIRESMTRLENLADESNAKTAAGALEHLGFLRMTYGDSTTAATDFRRAVKLDPSREGSWEMLLAVSLQVASPQELTKLCELRLKSKESARNRLLLAKLLAKQGKFDDATAQAKLALRTEPDNVVARLMLLALAMRQSTDDNLPLSVAKDLDSANKALAAMPPGEGKSGRARELILNTAIYVALLDQPDAARKLLDRFLRDRPGDQTARDIRNALP